MMIENTTGIVLAGGKSSRMGTDKALMRYNKGTLLEQAIHILASCCEKVVISGDDRYAFTGCEIWPDILPVNAPMSGIYSSLKKTTTPWNLILSCDMPLVDSQLYEWMFGQKSDHEVILPVNQKGQPEPLCGIYHTSVLPVLQDCIHSAKYGLIDFVKQTRCLLIKVPGNMPFYSDDMFANVNTQQDFNLLK